MEDDTSGLLKVDFIGSRSVEGRVRHHPIVLLHVKLNEAPDGHDAVELMKVEPLVLEGTTPSFDEEFRKVTSTSEQWPGAFAHHSPAAVKLTAVTNVVGRDLRRLRMVPGSRHDIHLLEVGSWMFDRLIVFDLGFYNAKVFQHIDGLPLGD
jgi:hypothetical protein